MQALPPPAGPLPLSLRVPQGVEVTPVKGDPKKGASFSLGDFPMP